MRITHHWLIGLNTLMVIEMIKQKDLPIPENINLDKILDVLGRQQRDNRKRFKNYLGAPDLVMDVYIEMPFGMDDKYEFCGHSLSAFQHFIIPQNGKYRGYNWDYDDSLAVLEELGDILMTMFSTDVKYDPTVEEYGFAPEIMVKSPMSLLVDRLGGNVDLDDFEFPTAAEVGGYYGDVVAKDKNHSIITRIKAAGFSLHFVMDACCAHHVMGYLLNGHSEWEAHLESNWRSRFDNPKDQKQLNKKFEIIAKEISDYLMENQELSKLKSVKEVIESNAEFTNEWLKTNNNREMAMRGKINRHETKKICNRAIASCIVSLNLMF